MERSSSLLEDFFRDIEGLELGDTQREIRAVEHAITHRVQAMLRYVFGICQSRPEKKPTAEKATDKLARVVARDVAEINDPQILMEEMAEDNLYRPDVTDALISMENALHENKDRSKPAAEKKTLKQLVDLRTQLLKNVA